MHSERLKARPVEVMVKWRRKFSYATLRCIKTESEEGVDLEGGGEREGDDVSPLVLCRERLGSGTVIYGSQYFAATFSWNSGLFWGGGQGRG